MFQLDVYLWNRLRLHQIWVERFQLALINLRCIDCSSFLIYLFFERQGRNKGMIPFMMQRAYGRIQLAFTDINSQRRYQSVYIHVLYTRFDLRLLKNRTWRLQVFHLGRTSYWFTHWCVITFNWFGDINLSQSMNRLSLLRGFSSSSLWKSQFWGRNSLFCNKLTVNCIFKLRLVFIYWLKVYSIWHNWAFINHAQVIICAFKNIWTSPVWLGPVIGVVLADFHFLSGEIKIWSSLNFGTTHEHSINEIIRSLRYIWGQLGV